MLACQRPIGLDAYLDLHVIATPELVSHGAQRCFRRGCRRRGEVRDRAARNGECVASSDYEWIIRAQPRIESLSLGDDARQILCEPVMKVTSKPFAFCPDGGMRSVRPRSRVQAVSACQQQTVRYDTHG